MRIVLSATENLAYLEPIFPAAVGWAYTVRHGAPGGGDVLVVLPDDGPGSRVAARALISQGIEVMAHEQVASWLPQYRMLRHLRRMPRGKLARWYAAAQWAEDDGWRTPTAYLCPDADMLVLPRFTQDMVDWLDAPGRHVPEGDDSHHYPLLRCIGADLYDGTVWPGRLPVCYTAVSPQFLLTLERAPGRLFACGAEFNGNWSDELAFAWNACDLGDDDVRPRKTGGQLRDRVERNAWRANMDVSRYMDGHWPRVGDTLGASSIVAVLNELYGREGWAEYLRELRAACTREAE